MSLENSKNFLRVKGLKTHFPITEGSFFPSVKGVVKAVDGVDLEIAEGEVLGLVGESGCGKSTLGKSIMRLVQSTEGSIELLGVDLASLDNKALKAKRPLFQMIFQDPYASLDPRMTVFDILSEPLMVHKIVPPQELTKEISRLMELVGLAPRFMKKYPHEFSGGQRQRISIARALALKPKFIIADEPVSALDVSIQSQILNLLLELKQKFNLTLLFISHDLSVIRYLSDRVAVMYLGKVVELGKTKDIFESPQHPYTKALLSAIPSPDPIKEKKRQRILLEGDPPSPMNPPSGCTFHPRCRYANDTCKSQIQSLKAQPNGVMAACHRIGEF